MMKINSIGQCFVATLFSVVSNSVQHFISDVTEGSGSTEGEDAKNIQIGVKKVEIWKDI